MTIIQDLGLSSVPDLTEWGVVTPADWVSGQQQTGSPYLRLVPTSDGRFICHADALIETGPYGYLLGAFPTGGAEPVGLYAARAMADKTTDDEIPWPEWKQIAGAGLGPVGAVDGWPVGARVLKDGHVWVSRTAVNVNEPLVATTSTWSRADGTFVVPAGWQYQPDEEVTEDGGANWFRIKQATSFAPSVSPSQYVQIDGPGGDPVQPSDDPQPWVQPTGSGDAYAIGDERTHDNPNDGGNIWIYRSKINSNTTEPGSDGTFDRWWEPVSPA